MKILVVATKPPWPPRDGGRLVLWLTLQALAAAGQELFLLAPANADAEDSEVLAALRSVCIPRLVALQRRSWPAAALQAARQDLPLGIARHRHPALDQALHDCLRQWQPDIVHFEQLQAAGCAASLPAGQPWLLRMQNVESSLWQQAARQRPLMAPLRWEARRLQRYEQRLLAAASRVATLTETDATALRALAPAQHSRIEAVAPAFAAAWPAGPPGRAATTIALAGSAGWWPNAQALRWFLSGVAPQFAADADTLIQVYGGAPVQGANLYWQPAPQDSASAFPAGAIAAVPLLAGSGIRMRILEAWARGLPVVASTVAATGLQVQSGRELLIADSADDFAAALRRLATDAGLRAALVEQGRAYLRRHHDPPACAAALLRSYAACREA
jgi:polysaccharide biosynthesis protein PslH